MDRKDRKVSASMKCVPRPKSSKRTFLLDH
jgi:hypothetical protein